MPKTEKTTNGFFTYYKDGELNDLSLGKILYLSTNGFFTYYKDGEPEVNHTIDLKTKLSSNPTK
jgi:hypothetical protein